MTSRRSFMISVIGAVAVQSLLYSESEASARQRLARAMAVALPPVGSFTVNASGFGDTTLFPLNPPTGGDTYLYRSRQMTIDESDIGLAEESCLAMGAAPTSYLVFGPAAGNFEQSPGQPGFIRPTAAFWAGTDRSDQILYIIPKRTGCPDGAQYTLTQKFATTQSDEFFASYQTATGVQTAQTGAKNNPWKYVPGSGEYTGTRSTPFGPGQVVFMAAEIHYTSHWKTFQTGSDARMSHVGNSTTRAAIEWNAWGTGAAGRGIGDGSKPSVGTPFTPTQVQAGGNTNYASLQRQTGETYVEGFMRFFQNTKQFYEATWPTPANLKDGKRIDYVSSVTNELYGFRNYPVSTTATPRRMSTNGGNDGNGKPSLAGTQLTVVDPDFLTLFAGCSNAADIAAKGGDLYGLARRFSSFFIPTTSIISYTPNSPSAGLATLVMAYNSDLSTSDGFGSFCLRNHPLLIAKEGQIVVDSNRTDFTCWPYTGGGTIYISRLYGMFGWGNGGYFVNRGGEFRRFANGQVHGGADVSAGICHWYQFSATTTGSDMINPWIRQCNVDNGSYGVFTVSSGGNDSSGMIGARVTHWLMDECGGGSGFRFLSGMFRGPAGAAGNKSTIRSTGCEISFGSVYASALGQSFFYTGGGTDNLWMHHNFVWQHLTIHGNGHSFLNLGAVVNRNILVEFCTYYGYRFHTGANNEGTDCYQYFEHNLILNPSGPAGSSGAATQANGSFDGVRYTYNLMLGFDAGYLELYIFQMSAGGAHFEFGFNVAAGINSSAGQAGTWIGNIHDNDNTVNNFSWPNASTVGGTLTGNTQYTGTPNPIRKYFDGTFTARDKAVLGLGPIGAGHLIAA